MSSRSDDGAAAVEGAPRGSLVGLALVCAGCAGMIGLDHGIAGTSSASDPGFSDASLVDDIDAGVTAVDDDADALVADASPAVTDTGGSMTAIDGKSVVEATDALDGNPPDRVDPRDVVVLDVDPPCPLTTCGGGCFDIMSDPDHCGSCSTACAGGPHVAASCVHGACVSSCTGGYVDCGGSPCSCGGGDVCLSGGTCGPCRGHKESCGDRGDCCNGNCKRSMCN